jgi:hypothetical protein
MGNSARGLIQTPRILMILSVMKWFMSSYRVMSLDELDTLVAILASSE